MVTTYRYLFTNLATQEIIARLPLTAEEAETLVI